MTAPNLESHKEDILNRLQKAGSKGLTKTGLNIKASTPKDNALQELERQGKIANLGSKRKTRYVLKEFFIPLKESATSPNLESHKEDILNRLSKAGSKGLSKSGLDIKASTPKAKALQELEKEREIGNLGSKDKTQYVLKEFFTPLENACEKIEKEVLSSQKSNNLKLVSRSKLIESLPAGSVRKKADEAIDWLVNEKKLLKIKHGNNTFFLHTDLILSILPSETKEQEDMVELNRGQALEAYRKVKQRIGFSNVEIYELQQELGVPMDQVKEFLLEESREGRVILSVGEWSLASEKIRSGAVYLRDEPHFKVRFTE